MKRDDMSLPEGFSNLVRLFPLPNLVLFPGVVQALHVFEPRYRELLADALAGDELVTMALVSPAPGEDPDLRPTLSPIVCIGKIVSQTQLEDGRYNVLLLGSQRARIVQELESDKPYRLAKVELVTDVNEYAPEDTDSLRQQLIETFRECIDKQGLANSASLTNLLDGELGLGQLTDLICYTCGVAPQDQQKILEVADICRRAEVLLSLLQEKIRSGFGDGATGQEFPPGFSMN